MREHVSLRCGEFVLLLPVENIGLIEPVASTTRFRAWRRKQDGADAVLDLRKLLGARAAASAEPGVLLVWQSADGARRATLLVDAVEEIVNCHEGDLIEAPILPARVRPLCDEVMRGANGTLRLRVKPDVTLPLARPGDRKRFVQSLVTREEPDGVS